MSKISLKPNDSGTGTFTLESPNSNTNRTLILPDADGTFVYQDSSGNVGIGTSSPSNRLEVSGAGRFQNLRVNAAESAKIELLQSGSTVNAKRTDLISVSESFIIQSRDENGNFISNDLDCDKNDFGINQWSFRITGSEVMRIDSSGNVGIGTISPSSTLDVNGSLSKNSGSFKIDHPLPEKSETHNLVHSFVESPRADNVYRGTATLSNGKAQVNLDTYIGMTEGTFSALNGNIDVFLQNKTGWEPLKGEVIDNILHVYCKDETSTDTVSWMVVGERQDQHMLDTNWTDEFGRPILEPEKKTEEDIGDDEESN